MSPPQSRHVFGSLAPFALAALAVAATAALRLALFPILGHQHPLSLFLIPVFLVTYATGWKPGGFALALSILAGWWLLIDPATSDLHFAIRGAAFAFVAAGAIALTEGRAAALRRVEEALRNTESRYRNFVDQASDAYLLFAPEGEILDVNRRACELLRGDRQRLLGTNAFRLGLKLPAAFDPTSAPSRGPWADFEVLLPQEGGAALLAEVRVSPFEADCKTLLLAVLRDVSERRKHEQALALFRTLLDRVPDAIEVIDHHTGRFLDVNEGACRTHGYSREEYLSLRVTDVDPVTAATPWHETAERLRLAGSLTVEAVHRRKDGSEFPVEVQASHVELDRRYVIAVVRDVTDRKRADEVLRLRNRAMQAVAEGILITDATRPENPIVYANASFERLTGYTQAEALGRNCRFLQGEGTDAAAVARIREAIREGRPGRAEMLNYRKDGSPFWIDLSVSPVRDERGRLTHFVGVQADVTARREMEVMLRHAQKMEALGLLAGGIAHDFNNLLTVINGYGDVVLGALPEGSEAKRWVAEMAQAGRRAATLTRQLLAFSRRQPARPEVIDLNAALVDLRGMLARLIRADVTLAADLSAEPGLVQMDRGQLEQIVVNLVVNARDAMPEGGEVTLATATEAGTGRVVLSVRDTGCGMSEEVLARIFEPYFTTKEPGGGTGLGLATVYGIVSQSGGEVEVRSEPGRGSTFLVYLPQAERRDAPERPPPAPRGGCESVLLVEDEGAVRELLGLSLRAAGYEVFEAAGGPEALRLADSHDRPIDLLLTDSVMPSMTGSDLAQRMTALNPRLRVLLMSGYAGGRTGRPGTSHAPSNFLQKPFSNADLLRTVREVLDAPHD